MNVFLYLLSILIFEYNVIILMLVFEILRGCSAIEKRGLFNSK